MTTSALAELKQRLAEIGDLHKAQGVLGWDQRVMMPPLGTEARAEAQGTLGRIAHDAFIDGEIGRLLDHAATETDQLPYDSDDASLVRAFSQSRRVPTALEVEMTREAARGHHAWAEARRTSDFASFLPYLRTNVELKRRYADCFEWSDSPYTALLCEASWLTCASMARWKETWHGLSSFRGFTR